MCVKWSMDARYFRRLEMRLCGATVGRKDEEEYAKEL